MKTIPKKPISHSSQLGIQHQERYLSAARGYQIPNSFQSLTEKKKKTYKKGIQLGLLCCITEVPNKSCTFGCQGQNWAILFVISSAQRWLQTNRSECRVSADDREASQLQPAHTNPDRNTEFLSPHTYVSPLILQLQSLFLVWSDWGAVSPLKTGINENACLLIQCVIITS